MGVGEAVRDRCTRWPRRSSRSPPGAAVGQHLLRPHHRCGLDPVAGEYAGGRVVRPVFTTRARSLRPLALSPAVVAAATNPAAPRDAHCLLLDLDQVSGGGPDLGRLVGLAAGTRIQSVSKVDSARIEMPACAERLQQTGQHADQRMVQRAVDAEGDERPDAGDGAGQASYAQITTELVRGPGDARERRLVVVVAAPSAARERARAAGPGRAAPGAGSARHTVTGDGHGATPTLDRPVVSGRPRARFMHWTAPPAVPLVRLSSAATATSRPAAAIDGDLEVHGVGSEDGLGLRPLAFRAAGGRTARRRTPRRRPRTPARS